MAITYDAPSVEWATASLLSVEPKIVRPIAQNTSAIVYENEYVQNECDFVLQGLSTGASGLDKRMASTTLDGAINSATTTITVASTAGFPCKGTLYIDTESIAYTGRTPTTFTGVTVVSSHSDTTPVYINAYLVEESLPSPMGNSLVQFARKYATVPDDWVNYKEAVFAFPGYGEDEYAAGYRCPQSLNATHKESLTYKLTTDPYTDLDVLNQMFRSVDSDLCVLDYVDPSTVPTQATYTGWVSAATLIYSAQSSLTRYAGNIWTQSEFETKAQ